MIVYRTLREKDIEDALNFWANTPGVHLHENGEDSPEGIKMYVKRNPGCSFIAEEDGELVGAVLSGHDGRRGFINHLGVKPTHRHRGIGRHLVELTTEELQKQGITKCALFVLKENLDGQAFYRAINWAPEGIVEIYTKIL